MKLYSSMRTLPVTNNAKGQQHEITLKLGLQSTEAYFPYIAYYYYYFFLLLCKKQCRVKIHAANILRSFFFLKIIPKDFPNASSMHMLLLQLSYISLF